MKQILKSYLEYLCGVANVKEDVPLSTKTTFKIGGPAKFFVLVKTKEILVRLISALDFIEEKYFVIGNGSNVLAGDSGFDGVVMKLGFCEIIDNGSFIYADAGAQLGAVLKYVRARDLGGLEWSFGIPATIGGAVYMNAGAHGGVMSDVVVCVDVLRGGNVVTLEADKLKFSHRTSVFQRNKDVILGAYFYLRKGYDQELENAVREKRKLNPTQPSAGSTFGTAGIGKILDDLGLKGKRVGGAMISEQHAGWIVNVGDATCSDVLALVKQIKRGVLKLEYVMC